MAGEASGARLGRRLRQRVEDEPRTAAGADVGGCVPVAGLAALRGEEGGVDRALQALDRTRSPRLYPVVLLAD